MKKNAQTSNAWASTRKDVAAKAASRRVKIKPWPAAAQTATTSRENSSDKAIEEGKLSLQNLDSEKDSTTGCVVSVVDDEEKKKTTTTTGTEGTKMKRSWADIIREHQIESKAFSETVSMQGLGPIFDQGSSIKRKLVWSTIVVMAIAFTAFNIYTQIGMFVGKPINVRVDFRKVRETPFPALTLCNNNFASVSAAAGYNPYAAGTLMVMKPLLFASDSPQPDFSIYDFSTVSADWQGFLRNLSQTISLLRCQWEQSLCSLTNFTPTFTDMGFCYTFNLNGTLMARSAGRSYGLKLTLDLQQDDYLRSLDHYYGAGFRVMVHAPEVPPIMSQKGVAVSPGFHNFLAIDVKQLKNSDPSVSNCGSKDLKYYTSSYSTEACYIECRTDHVYANCSCRDLYMPNRDVRICDPSEFYSCLYPSLDSYFQGDTACEDQCPEPCLETLYHVTPSANPLSQNFLREFSSLPAYNSSSETYWSQNLLHLEVYLTSMTLETVEKQLGYTLLQLFCDVGGAFGLLLGASLLTILEIVDFIVCRLTAPGTAA